MFVWDFFEKLDEIVYVTEMDTHRLVYMNEITRQLYGISRPEDYVGKHCYKLLQGLENPCQFCTNDKLSCGAFYTWSYQNPLLKKRYLLKDTMVEQDGKRYRIEIAIDADPNEVANTFLASTENMIGACLQKAFSSAYAEDSIMSLLTYLGENFLSERVYIFEKNQRGGVDNTYEWCAASVEPQKDMLQDVPMEAADWWFDLFAKEKLLVLEDIEVIRDTYPMTYDVLKPQNIHSLVAGPIYDREETIGFIGVDNPDPGMVRLIRPLFKMIGVFISTLLKRRDREKKYKQLSFYDRLTGVYNRNGLDRMVKSRELSHPFGLCLCKLEYVLENSFASEEAQIFQFVQFIRQNMGTAEYYRISDDTLLVICRELAEAEFEEKISLLRRAVEKEARSIQIGAVYQQSDPSSTHDLIEAGYQALRHHLTREAERERKQLPMTTLSIPFHEDSKKFHRFIEENYYDAASIFHSLTMTNSSQYVYFGDMQTNQFYISDNMRDDFGFSDNIVSDLLTLWGERIPNPEDQEMYRQDIADMVEHKRTIHDTRYKVRDASGVIKWIHCCGLLQWNEDKTAPVFFSGIVTTQDDSFLIDPITNFPRERSAIEQLTARMEAGSDCCIIAFGLNHFAMINETKGRYYANMLLSTLAERLVKFAKGRVNFFRLDGIRFIALETQKCRDECPQLVHAFKEIIETAYQEADVRVQNPCSFGMMKISEGNETPHAVVQNAISLISIAKESYDKEYVQFSSEYIQQMKENSSLLMALHQDVLNRMENFRIVIQPLMESDSDKIVGGEVLMRWRHRERDISPGFFIPAMENGKTIMAAGKWVFEEAVRACRRIIPTHPVFYLTFNVSYHQIFDEDFIPFIERTLKKYQVDGSHFVAELTETHFDENPERLSQFVEDCRRLGIRIALDDFGNGYSSLGLLLKYPASIIKLDRSLLMEMSGSDEKITFISTIVYGCHRLGKKVCMEGVETEEQRQMIKEAGCDLIQGFYYYRPQELKDFYELL